MTNEKYQDYLNSTAWASIKLDLYESRGKKCERCGSKKSIQVHHKTYKNIFNEEPEDLELLCLKCHKGEHVITSEKKKLSAKQSLIKKVNLKNKKAKKRN